MVWSTKGINTITSASGEYFVAAEIMKRGAIASLVPKNTPGIDILASSLDGKKFANIQVKTKHTGEDWPLGNKPICKNDKVFYIFSDIRGQYPDYYIVPSKILHDLVEIPFIEWKSRPKKSGKIKISNLRCLKSKQFKKLEYHHNNWKILGLW